jgi:hypothetical protein
MVTQGTPSTARILDFDNPQVPTGPISGQDPAFQGINILGVRIVPTWTPGGDTMTASSNVQMRGMVSQGGDTLAIADVGDPLDNPGAGAGFEILFSMPVSQFGALFVDQINMDYTIELSSGGMTIATDTFNYGGSFPAPPVYWEDASGRTFDRIVITDTNGGGGWGLDNLAVVVAQVTCYPDCDGNTTLDVFDFLCFQDAFVAMDPYADCDGNSVFDVFDFLCFQDAFVVGCP